MLRAERRWRLGLVAGEEARGLGKLLVVAPDQLQARRYLEHIRTRLPERRRLVDARLAVSDERDAAETLAALRLLPEEVEDMDRPGIVPLSSNATGLRYERLAPGPAFTAAAQTARRASGGEPRPDTQGELLDMPSTVERRLRHRIGELIAVQVVEEEEALRLPRGQGNYHRLNAVLKRVMGGKGRGEMTIAELEAAIGWLERNRLAEHQHLVRDDPRYAFPARRVADPERRQLAEAGQGALEAAAANEWWCPPVGRPTSSWSQRQVGYAEKLVTGAAGAAQGHLAQAQPSSAGCVLKNILSVKLRHRVAVFYFCVNMPEPQ
jgi:hypothetical protein